MEDEAGVSALVDELASEPAYAIDTEFHRERTYYPHLALVQIGWAGGIALLDPLAGRRPAPRRALRARRSRRAARGRPGPRGARAGVWPDADAHLRHPGRRPGFLGFSSPSLLTLTEAVLGRRLHKADQLADWVHRPLSHAQQAYAAGDVAHLLELHDVIAERLALLGRTEWAAEECAILLRKDRSATVPEEAWWRLPHARQLRGASRAVAQEVAAWRERRAQRQDLPVRFVLLGPGIALGGAAAAGASCRPVADPRASTSGTWRRQPATSSSPPSRLARPSRPPAAAALRTARWSAPTGP